MNKSIRLYTNIEGGDIKMLIPQSFKELDILSMKIYQTEEYPTDISDIGVVAGRISCKGVGLPNVKVSIFVPLDDNDSLDSTITALYPFKTIQDRDINNNRYNLLPKYRSNPYWNIYTGNDVYNEGFGANPYGIGYKPEKAVGTFFSQEEVCFNEKAEYIYRKYYKFTAVTNNSGDFMIMGVPVGEHTLHYDCDLTNIGEYSMKPAVLSKLLGYPSDMFEQNGTRFRQNMTLEDSKHIVSQNIPITVIPMWGNRQGTDVEIGVTRQDIAINAEIIPTTTVFFSGMTMGKDAYWYDWVTFRLRIGPISIKIPVINVNLPLPLIAITGDFSSNPCTINGAKNSIDPFHIEVAKVPIGESFSFNKNPDFFRGELTSKLDLATHRATRFNNTILDYKNPNDIQILGANSYASFEEDGVCAYIIPCNSKKIATNIEGDIVEVSDDQIGLYTEFKGAIISKMEGEIDRPTTKVLTDRVFMKIPQSQNYDSDPEQWLGKHHTFKANKYYSIAQRWYSKDNSQNNYSNTGMLRNLLDRDDDNAPNPTFDNYKIDYPPMKDFFTDRNVHFCLYFLQYGYKAKTKVADPDTITCPDIVGKENVRFNSNPLGGGLVNTQHLAKGANFQTNFVEVPKKDIYTLLTSCKRSDYFLKLEGKYYTPTESLDNDPTNTLNNVLYFKGIKDSDCIFHLYKYNLI